MNSESTNKDNLEGFYKRKFKNYYIEPLPYAFEKINGALALPPTNYSKFKNWVSNKSISLTVTFMACIVLLFWIWYTVPSKDKQPQNLKSLGERQNKINIQKHKIEESTTAYPIQVKIKDGRKAAILHMQKKKNEAIEQRERPNEKNNVQSDVFSPIPDTVAVELKQPLPSHDFKSNLDIYSQKKSEEMKDSSRQLFIPKK